MDNSNMLNQIVNHIVKNVIRKLKKSNKISGCKNQDYELTNNEIKNIAGLYIFTKYINTIICLLLKHKKICAISVKDKYIQINIYTKYID